MKKGWMGAAVLLGVLGAVITLKADMISRKTDADGHVLAKQWQAFHKAANADRPKEMAEILARIKADATKRHLSEDFYDAGREWVYAIQRRNWKESQQARETFRQEVQAFDEPIVTFTWMQEFGGYGSNTGFDYVRDHAERLRAARHPHFHRNLSYMDGNLTRYLRDDEEYALWKLLAGRSFSGLAPEKDAVYAALKAREEGVYPTGAYLEYIAAERVYGKERVAALQAVEKKYAGKAVALYATQVLLRERFAQMQRDKASESDYRAFCAECEAVEKARKAFRGEEKTLSDACTGVQDVLGELKGTAVSFNSVGRRIDVIFKNLPQAEVQFCRAEEGKPDQVLWTRTVVNDRKRFFLEDTTSFQLPMMDDGDYVLKCSWKKDATAMHRFSQYRLSLATRVEEGGLAAYIADYQTGEPVESAELVQARGGKEAYREPVSFRGFTRVPERFRKDAGRSGSGDITRISTVRELACEVKDADGFLRRSRPVTLWNERPDRADNAASNSVRCRIYKDRGAYNPGNTLQYKLVVFQGNLLDENHVVPAGTKLRVKFFDSESNEIAVQDLETGEFGSAAGSFTLPTGLRNGMFPLQVFREGVESPLASDLFRVDEFVLPTFDLTFDRRDSLYFQGDTVPVSGTVKSYSGHSLSGARLRIDVRRWGNRIVSDQEVEIAPNGTFRTQFVAASTGYYEIQARVTDGTGETLEFGSGAYVIDAVSLSVRLDGTATGRVELAGSEAPVRGYRYGGGSSVRIVHSDSVEGKFSVQNTDNQLVPGVEIAYRLEDEHEKLIEKGTVLSGAGKTFRLPFSGLYVLKTKVVLRSAAGEEIKAERTDRFLRVLPGDHVLDAPVRAYFEVLGDEVAVGENFGLRFGAADGPVWAVWTVYADGGKVLSSQVVHLEGGRGRAGSLQPLTATWEAGWPEAVRMSVFYFRNGEEVCYDHEFRRAQDRLNLPLSFSALRRDAFPDTEYTVALKTAAGVEALAAVYDKSLDAVATNDWPVVQLRTYHAAEMNISSACGSEGGERYWPPVMYDGVATGAGPRLLMKNTASRVMIRGTDRMAVEESAAMAPMAMVSVEEASDAGMQDEAAPADPGVAETPVRDRFEEALAFEPFLRSDADGNLSFTFRTSGKLSTYYVAVYAHDKDMRNALVRDEMVVSVPVKVAVNAPRLLYRGDVLQLAAHVSSTADHAVAGTLYLYVYDNADPAAGKPVSTQRIPLKVPAGGSLAKTFSVRVPAVDTLGLKTVFVAKEFSDALFQTVPVADRVQALTEAHSAVLLSGMDEEALLRTLRKRFVNVPGSAATSSVISVLDMVRDAIPAHVDPAGEDVLSLTEAWYVRQLCSRLHARYPQLALPAGQGSEVSGAAVTGTAVQGSAAGSAAPGTGAPGTGASGSAVSGAAAGTAVAGSAVAGSTVQGTAAGAAAPGSAVQDSEALLARILACRNADGGFAWFEGMRSSPVITAVVLDRFAKLAERGFTVPDLTSSVKWLDSKQFSEELPFWCGWVSDAQYMHIRSRYASVPFEVKQTGDKKAFDKRMAEFKKYAQAYLVPTEKDGRGLTGAILAKARRIATLRSLLDTDAGQALAKAWGIRFGTESKLRSSLDADFLSLVEYAVEHRDGGWYYPNAVMPFRGLLESEAYAHSLLTDLLSTYAGQDLSGAAETRRQAGTIADGLRIWLMLQKETQKWDEDAAYVDAITSILDGSDAVLGTKVLVLKADYTLPFEQIKAAGNGFTVSRRFFREKKVEQRDEYRTTDQTTTVGQLEEIRPGTPVSVGDKIVVRYSVWNQENRSFVRLTAPREAALMPVQQLSGHYGWGFRPLRIAGLGWSLTPQGYRNVKADRTEYFFDSFPEENTDITEVFFVTQSGTFTAPVVTIESLYAPHYRANAAFPGLLTAR